MKKKRAREFLRVLQQTLTDIPDIDTDLKKRVLSESFKNIPSNTTPELDSSEPMCISYPQHFLDLLTHEMSSETQARVSQEVAFGEFMIKNANACCGTPEQYCRSFWHQSGPLCNRSDYKALSNCSCDCCDEYEGVIIGINRGLFMLFNTIIKLILAAPKISIHYPGGDKHREFEPGLPREDVVSSIRKAVELTTRGELPIPRQMPVVDDTRDRLFLNLSFYAYLFVIAHELSHYLLGHVTNAPLAELELEHQKIEAFACTSQQERELEADGTAFSILMNYIYTLRNDHVIMWGIAGVEAMHIVFELCEWFSKRPPSASHPPAKDRTAQLRQAFVFPKRYYEVADTFASLGQDLKLALEG